MVRPCSSQSRDLGLLVRFQWCVIGRALLFAIMDDLKAPGDPDMPWPTGNIRKSRSETGVRPAKPRRSRTSTVSSVSSLMEIGVGAIAIARAFQPALQIQEGEADERSGPDRRPSLPVPENVPEHTLLRPKREHVPVRDRILASLRARWPTRLAGSATILSTVSQANSISPIGNLSGRAGVFLSLQQVCNFCCLIVYAEVVTLVKTATLQILPMHAFFCGTCIMCKC